MQYSHNKIQKMLKPIFEYMKQEHPNHCKLVIEPFSAQLIYEHQDQIWLSEEFNNKFNTISESVQNLANGPEMQKLKESLFDCCCDLEIAEQQHKDLQELSNEEYLKKYCSTTRQHEGNTITTIYNDCNKEVE